MLKRIEERNRQNEADQKLIDELANKALNDLCEKFVADLAAEGFSITDALDVFDPISSGKTEIKKTRAKHEKNGSKEVKVSPAADSTGAKPIPGTTYKLATGEKWTKSASGKGAADKNFLAAVQAGATWESLQVK